MNVVILQPSYIPWRGYFDQIDKSDLFIFYDDVKFDKNGWRNRNKIMTKQGLHWLTIPVFTKGVESNHTPINQIEVCWTKPWNQHHWETITQAYKKAPFFDRYAEELGNYYQRHPMLLTDFTIDLTILVARLLGNEHTQFMRSSEMQGISGVKTDRLIEILTRVGATHYISGPSAEDYIENEKFEATGISLEYMTYDYPEYTQLYQPFDPQLSALDLLFMTGPDAKNYF
jgi:hypothetical protein